MSLIQDIEQTLTVTPTLWPLAGGGFAIKFASITYFLDAQLSAPESTIRPGDVHTADMLLATSAAKLDAAGMGQVLEQCKGSKLVIPKSAGDHAHSLGIPYARLTTTDNNLRIEFWKDNLYGRIYSVPSATRDAAGTPDLAWTPLGGYPYLGYLIRFGRWTIYHPGDCAMYEGLGHRVLPYNVNVAVLPIGGSNFTPQEAAQLAQEIQAKWLIPVPSTAEDQASFVDHMLGHHPQQLFKVLAPSMKWSIPEE
jgi:L-ascorbate metabolism protein UlaG (beta-lactamase superfamily)